MGDEVDAGFSRLVASDYDSDSDASMLGEKDLPTPQAAARLASSTPPIVLLSSSNAPGNEPYESSAHGSEPFPLPPSPRPLPPSSDKGKGRALVQDTLEPLNACQAFAAIFKQALTTKPKKPQTSRKRKSHAQSHGTATIVASSVDVVGSSGTAIHNSGRLSDGSNSILTPEGTSSTPAPPPRCESGHDSDSEDALKSVDPKNNRNTKHFQKKWLATYPWLYIDGLLMKCKDCVAAKVTNVFVTGTRRYVKKSLELHDICEDHMHSERAPKQAKSFMKHVDTANMKDKTGILNLLATCYITIKENHSLRSYSNLVSGMQLLYTDDDRCNTFNFLCPAYQSRPFATECCKLIASQLRAETLECVKRSPCFSLAIDESTDVSSTQQMILYVWYLEGSKVETKFLAIVPLYKATAAAIHATLMDRIMAWDLPTDKFVAFGSDGASVMTGKNNGVAALLKRDYPWLHSFHCIAHKLALAAKGACKDVPLFDDYDRAMHECTAFYTMSPKRQLRLKAIGEEMELRDMSKIMKDCVPRWLSKGQCAESLMKALPAVVEHFSEESPTVELARMLKEKVTSFGWVATLIFFRDFLHKVNQLSMAFQSDTCDYEDCLDLVKQTKFGLHKLYIDPPMPGGFYLKTFLRSIPVDAFDHGDQDRETEFKYIHPSGQELPMVVTKVELDSFVLHIKLYANAFNEDLTYRFPNDGLNNAFRIFTPKSFPCTSAEMDEFGEDGLTVLLSHYNGSTVVGSETPLNEVELFEQWDEMRELIFHEKAWNCGTFENWWNPILDNAANCKRFPQVLFFIRIRKVLPLATACCERGFSIMGFVKTLEKSHMGSDILSSRMFVNLNGPEVGEKTVVHELLHQVFKTWDKLKLRRPQRSHRGKRPSKKKPRRDLRSVLAGVYDVSEDEDEDPDLETTNEQGGEEGGSRSDEDDEGEVCAHTFVPPVGVFTKNNEVCIHVHIRILNL